MEEIIVVGPGEFQDRANDRFRRDALDALAALAPVRGVLVVDVSHARHLDTRGIGALLTIRGEAARRRVAVRLLGLSEELRLVLVLARLDDRFELASA